MKHNNTNSHEEYTRGLDRTLGMAKTLAQLKRTTHEPTLIELYGSKTEKIGHVGNLLTMSESFFAGAMLVVMALNSNNNDQHYSFCFDGDSTWIMLTLTWK